MRLKGVLSALEGEASVSQRLFIDVAVELPIERLFTYRVPHAIVDQAEVGKRVLVPFRRGVVTGYAVAIRKESDAPEIKGIKGIKDIIDIIDATPLFDKKRLAFLQWMSSYYHAPPGEVFALACPGDMNIKSRRFISLTEEGARRQAKPEQDDGARGEILSLAVKGVSISTVMKRVKRGAVYSTVNTLLREGLVREEMRLTGGMGAKMERVASLTGTGEADTAPTRKAPLQAKVVAYLTRHGETPLTKLRQEMGGIDHPLKRLVEKGAVAITEREVARDPFDGIRGKEISHEPNDEQRAAIEELTSAVKGKRFAPFLLYGVTGSGKTLVYMKVIEEVVAMGRGVLFLVPEISLTPWPAAYLAHLFPGRVAIMHSGLSDGERYDQWRKIRDGGASVVVGARSALLAPVKSPGLIIVDEEHETSYKQEEGVRYNARDAALMMGKFLGLTVLLGSATPSMESFYNAGLGKIGLLRLTKRVEERPMPAIEMIDMRGTKKSGDDRGGAISERLRGEVERTLADGNQALLFLNRRGFSNLLICKECGHTFNCLNCSVSLTMHKGRRILLCHYCDFSMAIPQSCPECSGYTLSDIGLGTERVEEEVRTLFPKARVARMDRDTTRKKGSHGRIIDAVERGDVDILIGTQMIAKGHHFPRVTLVGIISGDTALHIPDFRGGERSFQMITQAAGRSGRGSKPGRVVVQSYDPENPCFKRARNHDYEGFFNDELPLRKEVAYPPFTRIALIRVDGNSEEQVVKAITALRREGERASQGGITILGPAPAFLARLKGRHRWQMLIKGRSVKQLHAFLTEVKAAFDQKRCRGVTLTIDVDPAGIS